MKLAAKFYLRKNQAQAMPNHAILIADSGSTKTDWMLVSQNGDSYIYQTTGLNPFILSGQSIAEEIHNTLLPVLNGQVIGSVYFYGTGCASARNQNTLRQALQHNFPNIPIMVEHDMLGAAKALCGHEPGIPCILGTGSNACVYDGQEIVDSLTSPGYIVGDEGSGNHLGRAIIRAYCYRHLPAELSADFREKYGTPTEIVAQLYDVPKPNAYLASFTKFLSARQEHPFIQKLVKESFEAFIEQQLSIYKEAKVYPIHFTGSISHYFSKILEETLVENGLKLGRIVRKPIEGLKLYHLENN